jgi:CheY-like chemotaxis protein
LRILLAEDSTANQQLAVGVLTKWGHRVTVAANGVEAVDAWGQDQFDVILMDVQMPEMDGFQATTIIRAREQETGTHIPIVAMTAHAMKGDREECLAAGMDDYVTKPIRWPDLRRALSIVRAPETAAAAIEREDEDAPDASLDWDAALRAVDGDRALLRDVLQEMVREWPQLFTRLQTAVDAGDAPAIRIAAHTLAGSLRMFGATRAGSLAHQLEELGKSGRIEEAREILPAFDAEAGVILRELERRAHETAVP